METKVNYSLVGAFVIVLLTTAVLGIIWLSSGLSLKKYITYAIYMQESVSGLSTDSVVEYNGVEVGKVKSIKLSTKDPQRVKVLLSITDTTPITQGTVATLTTRGLTGLVFIALKDKGIDQRPLVILKGQHYPVIKTTPSIFVRLDSVLTQFSINFREISASFHALLDKENLASIKTSLKNIQTITESLAINSKKLEMILRNTANASAKFQPLMQSGIGAAQVLEVDTLPAATRMFSNFDDVADSLAELSLEMKQNPSILIRGVERNNLGPGETK
jgi:phospholipid/cholesterol/gamma-HCH transport system substrate-binding protein